jgi:multicomponent Na+:H+ antiporter subunit D
VRFYYSVFGSAQVFHQLPMQEMLLLLALGGMFVASAFAIYQSNLKRLFAYSSVAQIGYIILGISLGNATGLTAAVVHLFNHGITKGAIFMLLGGVVVSMGGATLAQVQGMGRRMPLTSLALVLCGLSLIGIPGTAGFISKWYLMLAALEKGQWWLVALILLSSLLAIAYVWRFVEAAYFHEPREHLQARGEAPWPMLVPSLLLVAAVLYFGLDTSFTIGSASQAAVQLTGGLR